MTQRDEEFIKRLVEWITYHANYNEFTELCDELNVPEYWLEQFYEW